MHTHTLLSRFISQSVFFPFFQFALCLFCCFPYCFFGLFRCNPSTFLRCFRCLCNCSGCLRSRLSCLLRYRIHSLCRFYCSPCSLVNSTSGVPNNTTFFQHSCSLADLS